MADILVREALGSDDIATVRALMLAYGNYLAANPTGAANICISDYEQELASLPGPYAAPRGTLLLAFVDGNPAGCVALKPIRPHLAASLQGAQPSDSIACELKRLWIDPAFRGFGLGRRLMEDAKRWAIRMDYRAIYLDTVPEAMPEANRLYASMGFEPVERYNDNPVPNVVFFRLRLQEAAPTDTKTSTLS